jgi:photosystem II stability/assembly factor-like uncharacterized protein
MKHGLHTYVACLLVLALQASAQVTDWAPTNWPSSPYVQDIAIDAAGRVFALTYVDGVYRTTDDGDNWMNLAFPDTYVSCIATNNSGHVFIGTWGHGLYRSTNNGSTWAKSGLQTSRINRIAINTEGKIFVGLDGEGGDSTLYRSTDNGNTWTLCINGISFPQLITAITTGASGSVYASAVASSGGVFHSTDDGDSWTPTSLTGAPISLLITQAGHVFAGVNGAYKSTDNGKSWAPVDSGCPTDLVRSLIANATGYIFRGMQSYGASGGVCVSIDDGEHWYERTSGLPTRVIQALAMNSAGFIFAATFGSGVFRSSHSMTSVSGSETPIPKDVQLYQNYPNPFNPSTTISFIIPSRSFVSLKIFDLLGKEMATIVSGELPAGSYSEEWDASTMSSGMYLYRLQAGSFTETKKLVLLR